MKIKNKIMFLAIAVCCFGIHLTEANAVKKTLTAKKATKIRIIENKKKQNKKKAKKAKTKGWLQQSSRRNFFDGSQFSGSSSNTFSSPSYNNEPEAEDIESECNEGAYVSKYTSGNYFGGNASQALGAIVNSAKDECNDKHKCSRFIIGSFSQQKHCFNYLVQEISCDSPERFHEEIIVMSYTMYNVYGSCTSRF